MISFMPINLKSKANGQFLGKCSLSKINRKLKWYFNYFKQFKLFAQRKNTRIVWFLQNTKEKGAA